MEVSEITSIFRGRSVAYNVFSTMLMDVPDEQTDKMMLETAGVMMKMAEASENPDFINGAGLLNTYLQENTLSGTRMTRCKDFTHLFLLGAGTVSPYESVWTSPEKIMKQDSWSDVKRIYAENFYRKTEGDRTPEDHISLELQFMGLLCTRAADAFDRDDYDAAEKAVEMQKLFMDEHILKWIPRFADKLIDRQMKVTSLVYPAFGYMLKGFVEEDSAFLKEL